MGTRLQVETPAGTPVVTGSSQEVGMKYVITGLLAVIGTSFGLAQSGGEAPAGASGPAALEVSQTADLGEFLVDAEGMTLYMFTSDTENTSNCYGDCATAWPPVLSEGEPTLGEGLDEVGGADREDLERHRDAIVAAGIEAGAMIEEAASWNIRFRDPDGLLVELTAAK